MVMYVTLKKQFQLDATFNAVRFCMLLTTVTFVQIGMFNLEV